jgi:modulator of FtsH protease HflK
MERVYERANKVLLDPGKTGSTPMVVLPPELFKSTSPVPAVTGQNNQNAPSNNPQGTGR